MLRPFCVIPALLACAAALPAEDGSAAWLRYAALDEMAARGYRQAVPAVVVAAGAAAPIDSAQRELIRGIRGMLGRTLRVEAHVPRESAIVIGTLDEIQKAAPQFGLSAKLEPDGFWLKTIAEAGVPYTVVTAENDRGVLYGAFALLRKIALGEAVDRLDERQTPYAPVRWVNQWDNLDGSIERGYGGASIF
jgi:alpha-glucuronidase